MAIDKPATHFHGYLDTELIYLGKQPASTVEHKQTKRAIIQEREVSYRITPHFHPYVTQLTQRLLRESTAGLQAADTDYAPDNASLPGSIEVEVASASQVSLPQRSPFVLLDDTQITVSGGVATFAKGARLRLPPGTRVTLPGGTKAVLFDGMTGTPAAGAGLELRQDMGASLPGDETIVFPAATSVTLPDGNQGTLAAGARVMLLAGANVTLPGGLRVTLLRSRPRPTLYAPLFSPTHYAPSEMVQRPYPVKDLDFTSGGAYSAYNWELFFHVPLTIAIHLSKNQRFAEAQRWFHFLFDPTDDSDGPTPERFWKVRPFQTTDVKKIEEILINLSTDADPELRKETVRSIEAWKAAPFRPHTIARFRQEAYMYKTVTAYLDNLFDWGDSLFRQDTRETIDEAMLLYVLAANICGPHPLPVPRKGTIRPQTYANLRADLEQFGVVMREMEAATPYDLTPFPAEDMGNNERLATVRSLGKALYFCVPRNDMLLGYWDTVADRLFKIRNSLNFQGTFRQLALFEPPIDPALLARATAAGVDVSAIVNGLNQPLPLVRFQFLVQKAMEICQEVKSLGNSLLSAMEKEDNEALAILRAKHERSIAEIAEQVRYAQVQEAAKSMEGMFRSLSMAMQRYVYYERQLGKKPEEITTYVMGGLNQDDLAKMDLTMLEPEVPLRAIDVDIAGDLDASGGKIVSSHEAEEMSKTELARDLQDVVKGLNLAAQGSSLIPDFGVKFHFWGLGGDFTIGGTKISNVSKYAAEGALAYADRLNYEAGRAAKIGGYARREQEWAFQSNAAAGEMNQIFRQIRAAELRHAIAELELKNHRKQMSHMAEIETFLNEEGTEKTGKVTNKSLYVWMKREIKGLYSQSFQFAFDIARKAERALQHELGNPELRYLQFGYLAGKEGLLAGDKLYLDLKRMEMAYHDLNQREYELTRHVSLNQIAPDALLRLRETGRCRVSLPESLFDMDGPGHYFRRIKSVAVSIPSVTGPYASVNCTLKLLKSAVRTTPLLRDDRYERDGSQEDTRFSDYFGSLQAIVTSSAQNDSGLFETNLRDERYLPFENSGVISEWELQLPANPGNNDPRTFDYATISDVILHLRYTAREGGELLRKKAMENLKALIDNAEAAGLERMFSVRHEFPNEWARFNGAEADGDGRFALPLAFRPEHYPFWSQGRLNAVDRVTVWARSAKKPAPASMEVVVEADGRSGTRHSLNKEPALGNLLTGEIAKPERPDGKMTLFFDNQAIDDIWIGVAWSGKS